MNPLCSVTFSTFDTISIIRETSRCRRRLIREKGFYAKSNNIRGRNNVSASHLNVDFRVCKGEFLFASALVSRGRALYPCVKENACELHAGAVKCERCT